MGRSLKDLITILTELDGRGVDFQSLTENINTSTAMGRFFYQVLGAFAEMERELIRERTRAGLAVARARGRLGGRHRKLTPSKLKVAKTLLDANTPPREVAAHFGIHVSTLHRSLARGSND